LLIVEAIGKMGLEATLTQLALCELLRRRRSRDGVEARASGYALTRSLEAFSPVKI
jgi:hypothetical protein